MKTGILETENFNSRLILTTQVFQNRIKILERKICSRISCSISSKFFYFEIN